MSSVFGFSTEASGGGDFLPIIKYDARAGRMFRLDRMNDGSGWNTEAVDITHNFKALADFENVETGWINFATGGAPDFRMVRIGDAIPQRPTDQHKNGIRFMLKLTQECGGEKRVREVAGVAKAFLAGIEAVYLDYQAQKGENAGKLPVIAMEGSTPIKSGTGDKQSTNYQPKFKIVSWAPRGDLVFQPKNGGTTTSASSEKAATPPSTGSTIASPPIQPAQRAAETAMAEDDFG